MFSYLKSVISQTYSLIINPKTKIYNKIYKTLNNKINKTIMLNKKENNLLSWQSYILLFKNPRGKLIIDKIYIFIGNVPNNYYSYYINFTNWTINENINENKNIENENSENKSKLYVYNNKNINPDDIHLHIKIGNTKFDKDYFIKNPDFYLHFFPSSKGKIYKRIKSQITKDKIKIIDLTEKFGFFNKTSPKKIAKNLQNPLFKKYKHQIYGKNLNHVIFSGLV